MDGEFFLGNSFGALALFLTWKKCKSGTWWKVNGKKENKQSDVFFDVLSA